MAKVSLNNLRELKDDWDEESGVPPTEEAIQLAEKILNETPITVALSDGGVRIEWRIAGAQIDITPEGTLELE